MCYNIKCKEDKTMKQKWYTPQAKKPSNVIVVGIDVAHLPSKLHKYGALKNKAQKFEDRRFKKPKHKKNYLED